MGTIINMKVPKLAHEGSQTRRTKVPELIVCLIRKISLMISLMISLLRGGMRRDQNRLEPKG